MKANIKPTNATLPGSHETHSPEEILASGGATAFGRKIGKNNKTLINALETATPIEPFTSQEWISLLNQLEASK